MSYGVPFVNGLEDMTTIHREFIVPTPFNRYDQFITCMPAYFILTDLMQARVQIYDVFTRAIMLVIKKSQLSIYNIYNINDDRLTDQIYM